MRARIRDKTRAATCLGFGPRFQHSTGQAYKGGPNSGVFLQITCDDPADLDVPGHAYSFGVVKAAQARGDLDVLAQRGRRALARPSQGRRCRHCGTGARHRSRAGSDAHSSGGIRMQIGMIGLGRMGGNIARRLMKAGHRLRRLSITPPRRAKRWPRMARRTRPRWRSWCRQLADKPRAIWVMLPAGEITEETVDAARPRCWTPGDIIIDGGNSFYKDDIRRAKTLAEKGIRYVDCGTSGGVWGIERGYCMMIGGAEGGGRSSRPDLRGAGARQRRHSPHARPRQGAIRAPSAAIFTPARRAPGISSRWCTTASNTA